MAQIRQVVSESLQATIRRLLPSQQGFTEDLQATNVITPIIDLTPTAEGDVLDQNLQTALAFGSQTAFSSTTGGTTVANTPGFYRIFGASTNVADTSSFSNAKFNLTDGTTTKTIWNNNFNAVGGNGGNGIGFDFVIFLAAGESLIAQHAVNGKINGSARQIADVNGNKVNPSGFVAS